MPNISATLRRLSTWRSSSAAAVVCTRLNASARSPISSFAVTGTSRSRGGPVSAASSSATRASSCPATSATCMAAPVSACTGRITERRIATVSASHSAKPSSATPSSSRARVHALVDALSARCAIWPMSALVTFSRFCACRW